VLFTCSVVTFSFILRVAELPYEQYHATPTDFKDNLTDYGSSIWLTVITMTTVGYGDIYPHTVFGQITAIFIALWGTFVISLLIMVTA
jgi:voltage-gated potassium channel Kch